MKSITITFIALWAALPSPNAKGQESVLSRNQRNLSLRHEVQQGIDKGLAFLKAKQNADGSWPDPDSANPATTAFPLIAFQLEPRGGYWKNPPDFMKRGYDFLRKHAQPDGGIHGKELKNVNTALCLTALIGANESKDEAMLRAGRKYLMNLQLKNMAVPSMEGGFGYGSDLEDRQTADLHNTVCTIEALHAFRMANPALETPGDESNWKAAIEFVTRCQNLRSHNKDAWVSDDPANKGGFVYNPGYSTAGDMEIPGGRKALRSYGSMGSAGLICLVYAGVPKDDPRVVAAIDWLTSNFTLEENPGMGAQGLYLYYHLLAKGFAASGITTIKLRDGRTVEWARELAVKLVSLQKSDGSWVNENGRWMENDPILVTSYTVIALEFIHRRL